MQKNIVCEEPATCPTLPWAFVHCCEKLFIEAAIVGLLKLLLFATATADPLDVFTRVVPAPSPGTMFCCAKSESAEYAFKGVTVITRGVADEPVPVPPLAVVPEPVVAVFGFGAGFGVHPVVPAGVPAGQGFKLNLRSAGLMVCRMSHDAESSTIPHSAAWALLRPPDFVTAEPETMYWIPPTVSISTANSAPTVINTTKIAFIISGKLLGLVRLGLSVSPGIGSRGTYGRLQLAPQAPAGVAVGVVAV